LITISEITNDADFQSLQEAWDSLLDKVPDQNPFLSFEWVSNYRKHLGKGKLFILTAQQNDKICCIAPLCITQRHFWGMRVRVASFITTQHTNTDRLSLTNNLLGIDNRLGWSDLADFIYDPDHPEVLHETIRYLKQSDQWGILDLREIPLGSLTPRILGEEFGGKQYWLRNFEGTYSKSVLMPEGFESFKKSLKRKIKKNINLYANRLEKIGGAVIRHYQDADSIARLFPTLVALEQKGRKGTEETGALIQAGNREFHIAFAKDWADKGRSHIFTLEREQEVLSYLFIFQGKSIAYAHSTAINPDYEHCSPGFNLIIESLKVLSAQGLQTVNLGRGDGLHIRSVGNDKQPRTWIKVFKKTFTNRLLFFIDFVLRPKMKILSTRLKGILQKFYKNQ